MLKQVTERRACAVPDRGLILPTWPLIYRMLSFTDFTRQQANEQWDLQGGRRGDQETGVSSVEM